MKTTYVQTGGQWASSAFKYSVGGGDAKKQATAKGNTSVKPNPGAREQSAHFLAQLGAVSDDKEHIPGGKVWTHA